MTSLLIVQPPGRRRPVRACPGAGRTPGCFNSHTAKTVPPARPLRPSKAEAPGKTLVGLPWRSGLAAEGLSIVWSGHRVNPVYPVGDPARPPRRDGRAGAL